MSVIFDQLRISDDGQTMYIDVHVNQTSYFDNVYLKRATICTEEQVSESAPQTPGSDFIYQKDFESNQKSAHLVLNVKDAGTLINQKWITVATYYIVNVGERYLVVNKGTANYNYATDQYVMENFGIKGEIALHLGESFSFDAEGWTNSDAVEICEKSAFDGATEEEHEDAEWGGYSAHIGDSYTYNNTTYVLTAFGWEDINNLDPTETLETEYRWEQIFGSTTEDMIEVTVLPTASSATLGNVYHLVYYPSFNDNFLKSDLSHNLFFVYIECNGTPDICTPCELDGTTLGVTFDETMYYQKVMGYTKELTNNCTIPTDFTDFILLWNAFKASIETEHLIPAIKYWNMLFGNFNANPEKDGSHSPYGKGYVSTTTKPCGCHG